MKEIILRVKEIHCAKGPKICKKCEEAQSRSYYALYKKGECKNPGMAHPHYSQNICSLNITKKFSNEKEAKDYAKKNNAQYIET